MVTRVSMNAPLDNNGRRWLRAWLQNVTISTINASGIWVGSWCGLLCMTSRKRKKGSIPFTSLDWTVCGNPKFNMSNVIYLWRRPHEKCSPWPHEILQFEIFTLDIEFCQEGVGDKISVIKIGLQHEDRSKSNTKKRGGRFQMPTDDDDADTCDNLNFEPHHSIEIAVVLIRIFFIYCLRWIVMVSGIVEFLQCECNMADRTMISVTEVNQLCETGNT